MLYFPNVKIEVAEDFPKTNEKKIKFIYIVGKFRIGFDRIINFREIEIKQRHTYLR